MGEASTELQYSIVIPAYNEGDRIMPTLDRVLRHIETEGWDAEVIVVNDGSTDKTAEVVRGWMKKSRRIQLLENPGNRGKGYSVRHGMLKANGEVLLFTDADLSAPIEEANKLFQAIAQGASVAIGSRWLRAELQSERQPLHRQLFGRMFNLILRLVLGLKFKDTQCGFKAFTRRAAHSLFPLQQIERWGFDPELIFLAQKQGFVVAEVPVEWAHDEKTRISPLRDGLRMLFEVLKIRWNAMRGRYRQEGTPSVVAS